MIGIGQVVVGLDWDQKGEFLGGKADPLYQSELWSGHVHSLGRDECFSKVVCQAFCSSCPLERYRDRVGA